jgi:hypothetical protein
MGSGDAANSASVDNRISQEGEFPYRWHFMVIAVFALVAVVGFSLTYLAAYVSGRINNAVPALFTTVTFIPIIGLTALVFFLQGLFWLFKQLHWLKLPLVLIPLLILITTQMLILPAEPFLRGFKHWVSRNVDIEAIQRWLPTEGVKFPGGVYGPQLPTQLPEYFVSFKPRHITLDAISPKEPFVWFSWGGLAGWRLAIGPPTAQTPEAVGIERSSAHVRSVRCIRPGVYILCCTG